MKKYLIALMATMLAVAPVSAKKKQLDESKMGGYLMVYHKDCDHSLHMAVSYDGYTWTALNDDKPVISGDTIAEQHGIRDPHIFRGPGGSFYLAMTDLHIYAQKKYADDPKYSKISLYHDGEWERDGKKYGWGNNRGLVVMRSKDLKHWTRTNLDFTKLPRQNDMDWTEVGHVWAPETVWDYDRNLPFMHFTVCQGTTQSAIYGVHLNKEFTKMVEAPQLLFQAPGRAFTVIDSDVIKVGNTYHMFFVSHQGSAHPVHATSEKLTGPYVMDENYNDGERQGHEAPNCWKRIGVDKYVLMFDNYSRRPHNFGFVETSDMVHFNMIGYFDEPNSPMKRTNFSEQKHGAVIWLTKAEVDGLLGK